MEVAAEEVTEAAAAAVAMEVSSRVDLISEIVFSSQCRKHFHNHLFI